MLGARVPPRWGADDPHVRLGGPSSLASVRRRLGAVWVFLNAYGWAVALTVALTVGAIGFGFMAAQIQENARTGRALCAAVNEAAGDTRRMLELARIGSAPRRQAAIDAFIARELEPIDCSRLPEALEELLERRSPEAPTLPD